MPRHSWPPASRSPMLSPGSGTSTRPTWPGRCAGTSAVQRDSSARAPAVPSPWTWISADNVINQLEDSVRVGFGCPEIQHLLVLVRPAEQALSGSQQRREHEKVVPVDQARVGQASGELRTPMDEDRATLAVLELDDVVGRAQDRQRTPSLDESVVRQRGRYYVLGQL